jgi:hypothetical protein
MAHYPDLNVSEITSVSQETNVKTTSAVRRVAVLSKETQSQIISRMMKEKLLHRDPELRDTSYLDLVCVEELKIL